MVFTIGHSTHPIAIFIAMLKAYDVQTLVDVRSIPRSRYNPQFAGEVLAASLAAENIRYVGMKALGGRRKAKPDSTNQGWRSASFRGYADYMQTGAFAAALSKLTRLSERSTVAIMCAEAVPWRCHRSLIADALLAKGIPVEDILSETSSGPHKLPDFARVENGQVSYPGSHPQLCLPDLH